MVTIKEHRLRDEQVDDVLLNARFVRPFGFDHRRRVEAIDVERYDPEDGPADVVRDVLGCRHVGNDAKHTVLGRDHLAGRRGEQLLDRFVAQSLADLGQRAIDRRFEAGEIAAMVPVEAQIERRIFDFMQRRFDLGRGQTGEGRFEQCVAFGNAEEVRAEPLGPADEAVQEDGAPCQLVQRVTGRMRVPAIGDLRPAAPRREHPGVRAADIGIENGLQLARPGAAQDLVDDARIAQIDVRGVHHRDILLLCPDVAHDQGEQAKDAARALKGFDGR